MIGKPMTRGSLLCYAHGRDGQWQGICLDLDIAVQGRSFEDVKGQLEGAIRAYAESAVQEEPETRDRLLRRRAPLSVRLKALAGFVVAVIRHRSDDRESRAGFTVPCPA
ncbi:MAG TPA: hypothetical protein VF744_17105 [Beijerinckiaceae bacterium]|jgi:predicted RNase H-like HicB family nuclease